MTLDHRVLILIPAADLSAVNTWWAANIDPGGAGNLTFTAGLSTTGHAGDTPTVYWSSMALTDDQLRQVAVRLCQMAGVAAPVGWNGWTKQQKLDWLSTNLPTIRANTGIHVVRDDQLAAWTNPTGVRQGDGLQLIPSATSPA